MTDELTPREKEALKSLPRERMPAGLEARVTDAMREHGFLAKRRRTIAITSGRVGGLMAACVGLVIGAYSLGLHRGGVDQALPGVELMEKSAGGRARDAAPQTPAKQELAREKAPMEIDEARESEPAAGTDNDRQVDAEEDGPTSSAKDAASAPPTEAPATRAMLNESADRVQSRPRAEVPDISSPPLRFLLNDARVLVDAPDSVRVVKDDQRRMLLIYTSDGVIRIRLEENR